PLPPCNILGDFAGGGMLCALGILLALVERHRSGKGQVVDAAMVDGACYLSTLFHGLLAHGLMPFDIGANVLDGGAHFYQTYETRDGKFVAVGALEGRFYEKLLAGLGLDPEDLPPQNDARRWPEMTARFAATFRTRTRDEWMAVFEGSDACVAPVLDLQEVARHPHTRERRVLSMGDGFLQPSPAPRLSRTPARIGGPCARKGANTRELLEALGYSEQEIESLCAMNIVS
ncbi:MAG: CoA transferase, partial [Deltaproteobacteria bacterium]|nr:CoA transferase [Deltaproteobacteria bacterium]